MAHANMGAVLYQQGRIDESVAHLQRAVEIKPDYAVGQNNLGTALLARVGMTRRWPITGRRWNSSPTTWTPATTSAAVLYHTGRVPEAIAQWRESLRLQSDNVAAIGQLAAILATTAEASLRDGPQAVVLAQRVAQLTGGQDPVVLETLSDALAETGRFAEAIETAQRALVLASGRNDARLVDALRARIQLYQPIPPITNLDLAFRSPLASLPRHMGRKSRKDRPASDGIPTEPPRAEIVMRRRPFADSSAGGGAGFRPNDRLRVRQLRRRPCTSTRIRI